MKLRLQEHSEYGNSDRKDGLERAALLAKIFLFKFRILGVA